jgi:co-chaperonin GroES (HSP10)
LTLPTTKLRPLYNQVVVLRDEPPVKVGLIVLPDTVRDRLQKECTTGVVLRIGPGRYRRVRDPVTREMRDTHERLPLNVRVGDRVWFHHLAGTADDQMSRMVDIEEGGRRLTVMWDDEVQAIDGDVRAELDLAEMLEKPGAREAFNAALS